MQVVLSGVHVDVSDTLKTHAEERLAAVKNYFDQVHDVSVTLVQEPHHQHLHNVEITMHASGLTLHAAGTGIDWYAGVDDAVGKIMRQLEKYKGRLTKHRERRAKYKEKLKVMAPLDIEDATVEEAGLDGMADDVFAARLYADYAPTIMKKAVTKIAPMTVDEAVMQMDLLHKPAFLFLNVGSGELNMVYREEGNHIRWVAPKAGSLAAE